MGAFQICYSSRLCRASWLFWQLFYSQQKLRNLECPGPRNTSTTSLFVSRGRGEIPGHLFLSLEMSRSLCKGISKTRGCGADELGQLVWLKHLRGQGRNAFRSFGWYIQLLSMFPAHTTPTVCTWLSSFHCKLARGNKHTAGRFVLVSRQSSLVWAVIIILKGETGFGFRGVL